MTRISVTALLLLALLCAGCMQRVDADLPATAVRADALLNWVQVGTFGGDAVQSVDSADPYQVRFEPGGFKQIAGVCATDDEVWVCDLGISRIQVFDFDGNFLRSYGAGVPLESTLVSNDTLFDEMQSANKGKPKWRWTGGLPWIGAERELFQAVDVQVVDDGYWVADRVASEFAPTPARAAGVYFVPFNGEPVRRASGEDPPLTGYLAYGNKMLAVTMPELNAMVMYDAQKAIPRARRIGPSVSIQNLVRLKREFSHEPGYESLARKVTAATSTPGEFNHPCGIAMAFDKIVVCDAYNHRLQVFDARNRGQYWGHLLRLILPRKTDGAMRFDIPVDIDIAASGQVFLLDGGRNEVALLSSDFERLGSFARNDIALPWALDLSDDGRHCFISDRRTNLVYHYAAQD